MQQKNIKEEKKNLLRYAIISVFAVVIAIFILGPLEIYSANQAELNFSYHSFVWIDICIGFALCIVGGAIVSRFPKMIYHFLCDMASVLAMCCYVQVMFLNDKLIDGNGIRLPWDTMHGKMWANGLMWLGIIAFYITVILIIRKKFLVNIAYYLDWFLVLVQAVAVVFLLITTKAHPDTMYTLNGSKQFEIGQNHNIIMLVIDAYGNKQLDQYIDEDDFRELFHDFTRYTNTDCVYYGTYPSMAHLFTDYEVPYEVTNSGWIGEAWNTEKCNAFYDEVHKLGYKFNFFGGDGINYGSGTNIVDKFDSVVLEAVNVNHVILCRKLLKMSLYRYAPYVLKPYLELGAAEFLYMGDRFSDNWINPAVTNEDYYSELVRRQVTISDTDYNMINISHIFGMHGPYTTSSSCESVKESTEYETALAMNLIIETFMNQLRELGKYEDATIIITADHGSDSMTDPTPILLIKQSGESHDVMMNNNAPVSHDDFMPTILYLCGSERYHEFGQTFFESASDSARRRVYHMRLYDDQTKIYTFPGYEYVGDEDELIRILNSEAGGEKNE